MKPFRILYVYAGTMNRGGIESYMMNSYRHIDRTKIQIDFIVHGFEKGVYDDEIESMGGKIYHVPVKSRDFFGNIKAFKEIFNTGKYKIVHSHMDAMSMVVLKIAKHCGIPIRIAHSHNTQHVTNNKINFAINEYARINIKRYATNYFACSEKAGRWLFGDQAFNDGKVTLINNAIEIEKFTFNKQKRNLLREKLELENNFVIGHIGRFDYQKNHLFLLDIFYETLKQVPNAKLLLIGDGHLKEKIITKIKQLDIEDNIVMMGVRSDIKDLLNVFDLFILPSLFEGLGIVLIEAQANGLKCIASDEVPDIANITNLVSFVSLLDSPINWAYKINELRHNSNERQDEQKLLTLNGYNINVESEKLQNTYISLMEDYI